MNRLEAIDILATRINQLTKNYPLRVGIDGVDASGKSTLAAELAACLSALDPARPILQSSIDRFHNPRETRYRLGPDSPEGYYADSFDLVAVRSDLLEPLSPGGSRMIRTGLFDGRAETPIQTERIQSPENAILLFDGVFLQRPELAPYWDYVIFVQVNFETVLARAVERDLPLFGSREAVIERYHRRYLPAQQRYLDQCEPYKHADVVITNDYPQCPTLLLKEIE